MDTPRTVYKRDSNTPGSDVAATLAAASLVFRKSDPYSKLLLRTAMRVFKFADKYRGSYSNGLGHMCAPFTVLSLAISMSYCGELLSFIKPPETQFI